MHTVFEDLQRSDIDDVINDILVRHRDRSLTDISARRAMAAYVTSLIPDDFLSDADLSSFDVYLDITLQISKRATSLNDATITERTGVISGIALGDAKARDAIRTSGA